MASKHEGVRYPCDKCGYAATIPAHLKRHIECIHEGVRYPCNHCQHSATTADHLKSHIRSKHKRH